MSGTVWHAYINNSLESHNCFYETKVIIPSILLMWNVKFLTCQRKQWAVMPGQSKQYWPPTERTVFPVCLSTFFHLFIPFLMSYVIR